VDVLFGPGRFETSPINSGFKSPVMRVTAFERESRYSKNSDPTQKDMKYIWRVDHECFQHQECEQTACAACPKGLPGLWSAV